MEEMIRIVHPETVLWSAPDIDPPRPPPKSSCAHAILKHRAGRSGERHRDHGVAGRGGAGTKRGRSGRRRDTSQTYL
jgi:hypothetical protein